MTSGQLTIYVASTKKGGSRIGLALKTKNDCIGFFKKRFPETRLIKDALINKNLIAGVEAALFNKDIRQERLDLDLSTSPFHMKALKAISKIPYGETRTYGEVASMIGKPRGARAVGRAMKKNPLPLIFP
jgi:O6-methylguanine-DNA--protein-cysteine methyltransferase